MEGGEKKGLLNIRSLDNLILRGEIVWWGIQGHQIGGV